jgi:hypothetical protein
MDYAGLEDYNPYMQEPYISRRDESMKLIQEVGKLSHIREMKTIIGELAGDERREFLRRFSKDQIKDFLKVDPSYNTIGSY